MAQHLDSRRVFAIGSQRLWCRVPTKTRLEPSIKKFNPHFPSLPLQRDGHALGACLCLHVIYGCVCLCSLYVGVVHVCVSMCVDLYTSWQAWTSNYKASQSQSPSCVLTRIYTRTPILSLSHTHTHTLSHPHPTGHVYFVCAFI